MSLPRLERPADAPRHARVVVVDRKGTSFRGELRRRGARLAELTWNREGRLVWEKRFDAQGRAHGLERELDDDGRVSWQVPWRRGVMHGQARQFDAKGRCIMTSRFERGRGVDVFCDASSEGAEIAELRELDGGQRDGWERWGAPERPYEEGHFRAGKRCGVFRRWTNGALEAAYPKYFLEDLEVSQKAYRAARRRDTALPPDRRRDDRPARPLPPCLTDARVRLRPRPAAQRRRVSAERAPAR